MKIFSLKSGCYVTNLDNGQFLFLSSPTTHKGLFTIHSCLRGARVCLCVCMQREKISPTESFWQNNPNDNRILK